MTMKHSEPARFPVNELQMAYEGRRYSGHGLLAWDPDDGFALDARLELYRGDRPTEVSVGAGAFVLPTASLIMEVQGVGRGFARTPLYQSRVHDLWERPFWQNISFDRARFLRDSRPSSGEACFATYEYPDGAALLPEVVFSSRKLGERGTPLEGWSRAGLRAAVRGSEITGMREGTTLELGWALDGGRPASYRRWAAAIETALTAISARPIPLLHREIVLPSRVEEELRRRPRYSPIVADGLIGSTDVLRAEEFELLVACLEPGGIEALVLSKIVWGVMNAFQHRAESAIDLAIATILEGALRTLEGRNDKPWKVKRGLEWFRIRQSLPESWKDLHARVNRSYAHLRMRHAHPFWRRSPSALTDAAESLAHRNRLIRYLGLLVRTLARMQTDPNLPHLAGDPNTEL